MAIEHEPAAIVMMDGGMMSGFLTPEQLDEYIQNNVPYGQLFVFTGEVYREVPEETP